MTTILFDIDGTLLHTGGAGQKAMTAAMTNLFGEPDERISITFSGRTDRSIVSDFFRMHGVADEPATYANYCEQFLVQLAQWLPQLRGEVLPGIVTALEQLRDRSDVSVGLLTGNLRRAARLKLEHYGLGRFFYDPVATFGGFGDRHHERADVAREALQAATVHLRREIAPESIWIIGDTPNDVSCARAIGANVLAVATGNYGVDQLAETRPDLLYESLHDTDSWLSRVLP